jgi:pilus assembly protein CpaC
MIAIVSPSGIVAQNDQAQSERMLVVVGKSQVIELDAAFSEVIVGNPNVADVVVMKPDKLYLLGKALGTTNVQFLGPDGEVVRILDLVVGADLGEADKALAAAFPDHKVHVHSVNGGIRLSGSLPDQDTIDRALEIAQNFLATQGGGGSDVINTLSISDPPQVFLSVKIIEVARTAGQELTSSLSQLSVQGTDSSVDQWTLGPLDFAIDALAENGLARLLATPTLTAQSGETAAFLAGGEVPITITDENGNETTSFKEFGVRLTFTPRVINGTSIRLELEPEVSQISAAAAQSVDVPSFTTRRANTTVTLEDGESFAIAGLLQNNKSRLSSRFPFLGDVPVIGALFRDSTLSDNTTDLLILVTPSLTQPTKDLSRIELPTDDRQAADGWNFFAEGKHEVSTYKLRDALNGLDIDGPFGPILEAGTEGVMRGSP